MAAELRRDTRYELLGRIVVYRGVDQTGLHRFEWDPGKQSVRDGEERVSEGFVAELLATDLLREARS